MKESFWRSKKTKVKSRLQLSALKYKIERPPCCLFQIKIYCKMILIETIGHGHKAKQNGRANTEIYMVISL